MKKAAAILLTIMMSFTMINPIAAEVKTPAAYVALGDSLAAGQTPDSQIDYGYADLIAQELSRNQSVSLFSKELAFPGFTTSDVLERVKEDEAQELLASANIITLSAGANDLLRLVQADSIDGSIQYSRIQSDFALNVARKNVEEIMMELLEVAPNADVYVMGYYFAYPHARELQKKGIAEQLKTLNEILKIEAEKAGAVFVSVDEVFGQNATSKVPESSDVHPNIEGYQAMANQFLAQYRLGWKIEDWELPEPNPISFEEILQGQEQQMANPPQAEDAIEKEETVEQESAEADIESAAPLVPNLQTEYLALRNLLPVI